MPAIDAEALRLDLHGRFGERDVQVTYSPGLLIVEGFTFTFNNPHVEYRDEDLTINETEIGRLITVPVPMFSTRQTVSFSLLVPTAVRTSTDRAGPLNVTGLVIITNWQSPTEEHLAASYSVVWLEGTASQDPE
jgi:hypothetical protein